MKTDKAKKMLNQIISNADRDKDKFMYFYASVDDGDYIGGNQNMDMGDALIVIRQMITVFKIKEEDVQDMYKLSEPVIIQ